MLVAKLHSNHDHNGNCALQFCRRRFFISFFLKVSFSFFLISCCFAKSCYFEYFEMPRELFVDSFRGRRIYSQDSRIAIHFDCCEGETFSHLLKTYKLAMTQFTNRPTLFEFIKTACFGVKYLRYGGKNLIIWYLRSQFSHRFPANELKVAAIFPPQTFPFLLLHRLLQVKYFQLISINKLRAL